MRWDIPLVKGPHLASQPERVKVTAMLYRTAGICSVMTSLPHFLRIAWTCWTSPSMTTTIGKLCQNLTVSVLICGEPAHSPRCGTVPELRMGEQSFTLYQLLSFFYQVTNCFTNPGDEYLQTSWSGFIGRLLSTDVPRFIRREEDAVEDSEDSSTSYRNYRTTWDGLVLLVKACTTLDGR